MQGSGQRDKFTVTPSGINTTNTTGVLLKSKAMPALSHYCLSTPLALAEYPASLEGDSGKGSDASLLKPHSTESKYCPLENPAFGPVV